MLAQISLFLWLSACSGGADSAAEPEEGDTSDTAVDCSTADDLLELGSSCSTLGGVGWATSESIGQATAWEADARLGWASMYQAEGTGGVISLSDEGMVIDGSVNLTFVSDLNPAATYTCRFTESDSGYPPPYCEETESAAAHLPFSGWRIDSDAAAGIAGLADATEATISLDSGSFWASGYSCATDAVGLQDLEPDLPVLCLQSATGSGAECGANLVACVDGRTGAVLATS